MIESTDFQGPLLQVDRLRVQFGGLSAVRDVSFNLAGGNLLGLIGPNGAGKTTLLRSIAGLQPVTFGETRVLGEPVGPTAEVLRHVGFTPDTPAFYDELTVRYFLKFIAIAYGIHGSEADERIDFWLDKVWLREKADQKIKTLSRGQRARAGLLVALAHRPDLLVLDEPSSGLDPVVRRDILGAIIRTIAEEGRTVLFSSHLLDEVERVADRVAIIHQGQIMLTASMDEIKEQHRRVTLRFEQSLDRPPSLVGTLSSTGKGNEWTYVCSGERVQLRSAAEAIGATVVEDEALTLDEIFVSRIQG